MAQDTGWSNTRILLVLGAGLLLVAAWQGGRMSAGGGLPFGMMDMHGEGMMRGGGMQRHTLQGRQQRDGGNFDGEAGLQRCRAMMGTMAGMHRSMQSMMGSSSGNNGEDDPSGQQGRMEGGMMGGSPMHGPGSMPGQMRSRHEQMGHMMEGMDPDEMRSLCRTMRESMRAAMQDDAPDDSDAAPVDDSSLNEKTTQWLQGARGFEGVVDRTNQDEVVVEVGAGDGLAYGSAAIRVDPGTTIRWRWTGKGGLHDVAFVNIGVSTSLKDTEGATFTRTFESPGTYRYECTPHAGIGMRGAIIVTST